jgi:hypothetical protein
LKHPIPSDVTEFGISIEVNPLFSKQLSPIDVTELGIFIELKPLLLKQFIPKDVTEFDIVTETKFIQLKKQLVPIDIQVVPTTTLISSLVLLLYDDCVRVWSDEIVCKGSEENVNIVGVGVGVGVGGVATIVLDMNFLVG